MPSACLAGKSLSSLRSGWPVTFQRNKSPNPTFDEVRRRLIQGSSLALCFPSSLNARVFGPGPMLTFISCPNRTSRRLASMHSRPLASLRCLGRPPLPREASTVRIDGPQLAFVHSTDRPFLARPIQSAFMAHSSPSFFRPAECTLRGLDSPRSWPTARLCSLGRPPVIREASPVRYYGPRRAFAWSAEPGVAAVKEKRTLGVLSHLCSPSASPVVLKRGFGNIYFYVDTYILNAHASSICSAWHTLKKFKVSKR